MSTIEHLSPIEVSKELPWQQYLLDSVLAIMGSLLVTGIIFMFHLYPRIPNISIVYLLVVLALATVRRRYAAILAAVVAFLSFDFFIVPPLYTFVIYHVEEWIALFVFLIDAILTGQLAVALRERAEQASRRERETRILYDLVRVTNREAEPERQLHTIAQAIADVFSSWGVRDCAILQPDATGNLQVQASAYQPVEQITLSSDEKSIASMVMAHGRSMGLYEDDSRASSTFARVAQRIIVHSTAAGRAVHGSLRLIPLKVGQQAVGVLRLRIWDDERRVPRDEGLEDEYDHAPNARTTFFWTFLDQATSLVERARLQRENLRIEVLQRTDVLRGGFAQSIEHEADRLNRLVGNLLDMSRIEEGALKPEKEWYSLKALIHDVLGRLRPLLEGRTVRTHLTDDLLLVELDYMQIDQVLTNLIENAVRYTPAGSPIDVSAHIEGEQVMLSVADRGPGIPPADLERVFDKFYRVLQNQHSAGYPSGSGLGLAVCKGLVEAHGGRIWAELREGGGLVVCTELPVGKREEIVL